MEVFFPEAIRIACASREEYLRQSHRSDYRVTFLHVSTCLVMFFSRNISPNLACLISAKSFLLIYYLIIIFLIFIIHVLSGIAVLHAYFSLLSIGLSVCDSTEVSRLSAGLWVVRSHCLCVEVRPSLSAQQEVRVWQECWLQSITPNSQWQERTFPSTHTQTHARS